MARRTIKRQLDGILQEIYTELNFPSEVILVCFYWQPSRLPLAPSTLFFAFDELATLYDTLGDVGKYTSVASLPLFVGAWQMPSVTTSPQRSLAVVAKLMAAIPLQTLVTHHHNVKNISEVRDQVAAQLGLPATFAITLTPYSKVRSIDRGFATLGLRCYLRSIGPATTAESFREGLYRRLCISGELRLTNAGQELRGRLGNIIG